MPTLQEGILGASVWAANSKKQALQTQKQFKDSVRVIFVGVDHRLSLIEYPHRNNIDRKIARNKGSLPLLGTPVWSSLYFW